MPFYILDVGELEGEWI